MSPVAERDTPRRITSAPDNVTGAVDLGGARIHYREWSRTGPRVLLLHPIGFSHHTWDEVAPALADRYHVVALDLPGHGASDKPLGVDYGLRAVGRRVLQFLDELGWKSAHFVGNSIGGGTALSAAVQAPGRVDGLALLNSVGFRRGLPPIGWLAFMPLVCQASAYTPRLALRLGLEFARYGWGRVPLEHCDRAGSYFRDPAGRAAFFRMLRQLYGPDLDHLSREYGRLRLPAVVLHGERDPLISLAHARRLADAIPDAPLERIPDCGHFPQEERPDEVARRVRRFLDALTTRE